MKLKVRFPGHLNDVEYIYREVLWKVIQAVPGKDCFSKYHIGMNILANKNGFQSSYGCYISTHSNFIPKLELLCDMALYHVEMTVLVSLSLKTNTLHPITNAGLDIFT